MSFLTSLLLRPSRRRDASGPEGGEREQHGAERDLPPDRTIDPLRAPEPAVAATQVPADDAGNEEQEAASADREDALILPARTAGP